MRPSLDEVLGPGAGETPESRARASQKLFVRSLDQLAEYSPKATGRQMSASEALAAYGYEVLEEVAADGSALLAVSPDAAARAIRSQRDRLDLSTRTVAVRANLSVNEVERAEQNANDVRLRTYERIACVLGMDERQLSRSREPAASAELAVRLRNVGELSRGMNGSVVSAISEAAWVAQTQVRLEESLGIRNRRHLDFQPSTNYGRGDPAYVHGYYLAQETRRELGLGTAEIPSMRALCEELLGIPVIQAELGEWVAGATVEVAAQVRAIVVNISGGNHDVFMRRATLAHEVGHLLYDPPAQLNRLRVDEFDDLTKQPHDIHDRVEQRANAFAVELLAPQDAALRLFDDKGGAAGAGLREVIRHFGIGFTAARYQIWNGLDRAVALDALTAPRMPPEAHWVGAEQYTVDYNFLQTAVARSGRFSAVVLRAAYERVISWDTASEYLRCSTADAQRAVETVRDLFPSVFAGEAAT